MKGTEAARQAEKWWEEARHLVPKEANREIKKRVRAGGKNTPALVFKDVETVLPSGILNGLPWNELERGEKLQVVKLWHHFFVRKPMQELQPASAPRTKEILTLECDDPLHPSDVDPEEGFEGPNQANVFSQAMAAGWTITREHDYCPVCTERRRKAETVH